MVRAPCGRLISAGKQRYADWLAGFPAFIDFFTSIDAVETADERTPHWDNPWLPPLDAICLTSLLIATNPRRYVEVGSGASTKYVRKAIEKYSLRTSITSIDPHPRASIDEICDEVVRDRLEDVDCKLFAELDGGDVVFIDNSHRSFQNSDVTIFFTEVLPSIPPGCIYGIHDIFLPNDYPEEWLGRFYNEQYLLMAYLLGGAAGDDVILPVRYVQQTPDLLKLLDPIFKHPALHEIAAVGGAFWMRKAEQRSSIAVP